MGVALSVFATNQNRNSKTGRDMSVKCYEMALTGVEKHNNLVDTMMQVPAGEILLTMCKQLFYAIRFVLQEHFLDATVTLLQC